MAGADDLIRAFIEHQAGRGLSPNTTARERIVVARFAKDLPDGVDLLTCTEHHVEAWSQQLRTRVADRTRSVYLSYLASFYRWAVRYGHRDTDPLARVDRPKLRRLLPRPVATDDLRTALEAAPDDRMRLWLCLGAYSGLRVSEIAGLRWEDIHLGDDPPFLVVDYGKGGHQRQVPISEETEVAFRAFGVRRTGWVFPGRACTCHPMKSTTISKYVGRYFRSLGIDCVLHPLRHWFGSEVYRQTKDLRLVQELLGHASITTTQGYTKLHVGQGVGQLRKLSARATPQKLSD